MCSPAPDSPIVFPPAVLAAFPPSPSALMATICLLVTNDMLGEISQADYGQDADAHLNQLLAIRDTLVIPAPMRWEPQEVLELIRWSEPADPTWKPGATGRRGHLMRAFACTVLLRAADEDRDGFFSGENSTLAQLIDSALELSADLPPLLARYLVWRATQLSMDFDRPVCLFALLLAIGLGCDRKLADSELDKLAQLLPSAW